MSIEKTIIQITNTKKQKLGIENESKTNYVEKIKTRMIYYCQLQLKNTKLSIKEIIENCITKFCLHRL
jgi:hypothetical protein